MLFIKSKTWSKSSAWDIIYEILYMMQLYKLTVELISTTLIICGKTYFKVLMNEAWYMAQHIPDKDLHIKYDGPRSGLGSTTFQIQTFQSVSD